jgi:iron(III) transport system substrate-binding protein
LALLLVAVLAGCGGDDEPTAGGGGGGGGGGEQFACGGETIADADLYGKAKEEGQLLVYTTYAPDVMQELHKQFTEATGIEVEQVRLVSPQMYERVMSEHGAGRLSADIIENNDIALMGQMGEAGIFTAHKPPSLAKIPQENVYEDGLWYAPNRPLFGIAYNTELVKPEDAPKTWTDLTDPRFKGKLGMTGIATGTGWSQQYLLHKLGGEQLWRDIKAQDPKLYESVVPAAEEMVRGEVAVTLNHAGTILALKEQGAPVEMVFPEEGFSAVPQFSAIGQNASHPSAAQVYMNWRLSKCGSQVFADISGDYTAHPDVKPTTIADTTIPLAGESKAFLPTREELVDRKKELAPTWSGIFGRAQ